MATNPNQIPGGSIFQNLMTAGQFSPLAAGPWSGGYPGASSGGPGNLTFGLAGSPMGSTGTTNYFLNGQSIAGANISGALAAIQQQGASTPGTGSIGTGGFDFNTGAGLGGVPSQTGLPDYSAMLQWLTGQQGMSQSPQGPVWP